MCDIVLLELSPDVRLKYNTATIIGNTIGCRYVAYRYYLKRERAHVVRYVTACVLTSRKNASSHEDFYF